MFFKTKDNGLVNLNNVVNIRIGYGHRDGGAVVADTLLDNEDSQIYLFTGTEDECNKYIGNLETRMRILGLLFTVGG